jgi:hypothetical protein
VFHINVLRLKGYVFKIIMSMAVAVGAEMAGGGLSVE